MAEVHAPVRQAPPPRFRARRSRRGGQLHRRRHLGEVAALPAPRRASPHLRRHRGLRSPKTDIRYIWTFELQVLGSNGWTARRPRHLAPMVEAGRMAPVIDRVLPLAEAREGTPPARRPRGDRQSHHHPVAESGPRDSADGQASRRGGRPGHEEQSTAERGRAGEPLGHEEQSPAERLGAVGRGLGSRGPSPPSDNRTQRARMEPSPSRAADACGVVPRPQAPPRRPALARTST